MSTENCPLISVVIPVYNREHYIAQAIESVATQDYPNWEVIVVDDCSTDGTVTVAKKLQQKYPIQLLNTPYTASGPSVARNIGIKAASGFFVMFLDSDDLFYPDAMSLLYQQYCENPDKAVIQGFYSSVDVYLNPIRTQGLDLIPLLSGGYRLPYGNKVDWLMFVKGQMTYSLTTCLFTKQLLDEVGLLNENIAHWEDYEYFIRIKAKRPQCILPVPYYIVKYRHQPVSISRTVDNTEKMLASFLSVLDILFAQSLPAEALQYRSFTYLRAFRIVARMQLINHRKPLARKVAFQALQHPAFSLLQWFKLLLPLVVQSYFPDKMYDYLADINRQLRLKRQALQRPLSITH